MVRVMPSLNFLTIFMSISFILLCFVPKGMATGNAKLAQGFVKEGQILFESGVKLYDQGHEDLAINLFKESHSFLLEADAEVPSYLHQRLNNVFEQFYSRLHRVDPELCDALRLVRTLHQSSFTQEDLEQGQIQKYIDTLINTKRGFLRNGFRKAPNYLPMIQNEFLRQGLPQNLAYLAFIESCFEPEALSHAGARGMWQFMPETAKAYGLEVSAYIDERLDPIKSTGAAARYLKKLYKQFGNWPLALAAYNCGENRVERALRDNVAVSFWDLAACDALPLETLDYVPKFIAVAVISNNLHELGIAKP